MFHLPVFHLQNEVINNLVKVVCTHDLREQEPHYHGFDQHHWKKWLNPVDFHLISPSEGLQLHRMLENTLEIRDITTLFNKE